MFGKVKDWICFALTALAVSASAFVPDFQSLKEDFPNFGKTEANFSSHWKTKPVAQPFARSAPFGGQNSFTFDPNWNVLSHRGNEGNEVEFGYDEMNRLTGSTQSVYSVSSVVQNFYDFNGNRTNIVYPGGLNVSYSYDEEDRLIGVTTEYAENTESFSFGYDGASRLTNIVYPNGVGGEFSYDAESRIIGYSYSGSSNFISRTMARDARGYKTSETINSGLEPELIEGEQRMEHNDADQLTKITQRDSWLGGELNQWYNREYGYDGNGCLLLEYVSRELWNTNSAIDEYRAEYTWDYDNRLTGEEKTVLVPHDVIDGMTGAVMERTYTDGPSVSTEYIYDASGVRIGRVHNSVTNYFVVDYSDPLKRPLCETDSSGTVTRYYVWAGFRLLAHIEADGAIRCYHSDGLGSTLAITDAAGTVTDQFAYTPYGKCTARIGTTQTPFCWLGGYGVYFDSSANLHLTLYRAYSADMRRWLSADPLGIDGFENLYAYGNLNPLYYTDPSGNIPVPVITAIYGAIAGAVSGGITGYAYDGWNGVGKGVLVGAGTGALTGALMPQTSHVAASAAVAGLFGVAESAFAQQAVGLANKKNWSEAAVEVDWRLAAASGIASGVASPVSGSMRNMFLSQIPKETQLITGSGAILEGVSAVAGGMINASAQMYVNKTFSQSANNSLGPRVNNNFSTTPRIGK